MILLTMTPLQAPIAPPRARHITMMGAIIESSPPRYLKATTALRVMTVA